MKKLFLYIIIAFFVSNTSNLFTQEYFGWTKQTSNTTNYLSAINFPRPNIGFVAGDHGTILRTTNGGDLWQIQLFDWNYDIRDIYFPSINTGYAVGGMHPVGALVMKTTNNGINWVTLSGITTLQPLINSWLNSVYFLNENTGYIAGYNGTLMKTTNGGIIWDQQVIGTTFYLNDIYFTNLNTGYISGQNGILKKTTNAGSNWFDLQTGVGSDINSIFFRNDNTGYIAGYNGYIGKTTNAGSNWSLQQLSFAITTVDWTSIYFADDNTGYAVGQQVVEFKTTNAGLNWFFQLPIEVGNLESVYFTSPDTGYATGVDFYGGLILKTSNGGQITGIQKIGDFVPQAFSLSQNFPNPFNPSTRIRFDIAKSSFTSLTIYDVLGRKVSSIVNKKLDSGTYLAEWNAVNNSSGIYFYRLQTETYSETKRMILVK